MCTDMILARLALKDKVIGQKLGLGLGLSIDWRRLQ